MTRYTPTRAGIINLWDYRDEEFCFAGGWLVLRGPNGSGKTKALEVLFPFVLDGRIDPKRLNPFAAEDRTMKSNLLYRGQENAVGYVWLEFRDGSGQAVTIGIGMHAQRHRDTPVRWHFLAEGRVGEDFSLLTADDRPMTRKQLAEELGESALHTSPTDYREAIDRRLFGLGRERYEQLLTLILTLRRPQLAKNLDPIKLSDTLTEGLRPVDDELITEAARSFDDMESVSRTLEGLAAADEATRVFLASYSTYLRTHARWEADALSRRRAETAARRDARRSARLEGESAAEMRERSETERQEADNALAGLRARVEQLKSSAAYEALGQLEDLARLVANCREAAEAAGGQLARRVGATARARADAERAGTVLAELTAVATRTAAELADHASAAGIAWRAEDAEPEGLAERVTARAVLRAEAVRAVREAQSRHAQATQARDLARLALDRARAAAEEAADNEAAADAAVAEARSRAAEALSVWRQRRPDLLADAANQTADDEAESPDAALFTELAEALDLAGRPEATAPAAVFDEHAAPVLQGLRERRAELRARRGSLLGERSEVTAERDRIAAEHDDAPPPSPGRPEGAGPRPAGAPLWQLVRFAEGVGEAEAGAIEAALHAAGLLDAWLAAEDAQVAADHGSGDYLLPGEALSTENLTEVLVPEEGTAVPAARITALLRSIALVRDPARSPDRAAVGRDGGYAHGITVGAHHKPNAEYIGATARARRRAARIEACDARIAVLDAALTALGAEDAGLEDRIAAFAEARASLPSPAPIATAVHAHLGAAGRLRSANDAADLADSDHDQAVAACAVTERALRRAAAEHALDPERVEQVEAAVRRFEACAEQLVGRRREQDRQSEAAEAAAERQAAQLEEEQAAAQAERAARRRHTEEEAKYEALHDSLGAEAEAVLARIRETEAAVEEAGRRAEQTAAAERAAIGAEAAAAATLNAATEALRVAATEEKSSARTLAPYAARELLDVIGCPPNLAWPAQESDWSAEALPTGVVAVHEAILAATRELAPSESSLKVSTTRLTKALDELQTRLAAAGQDYHPEWDGAEGVIVVRIADEQGPLPAAAFAARITEARRDQQMLLSESEQRILEDALLTRLAQQIHERTVDARDLIHRMNKEMRSRRMSSGTTVGVRWQLADNLDEEQRAVCALLDADAARLAPDALARMRRQFAAQIKDARAREQQTPYRELLAKVLDYRRWRQFGFQLVRPESAEETLTRARHSRLSGGEQSVSLHLPLFAAAHAMLNSAAPHAPRLLALDEAFAGVDETGRGELMSLAAQFDLDLFMTGYDLWATHAAVGAAAHYDLAHSPVEHTVSALLMVWDGGAHRLLADDEGELTAALGSPGTRRALPTAGY